MSNDPHYGGNAIPVIEREEHDHTNMAKRVSIVSGGANSGNTTLNPSPNFIGIVSVANQIIQYDEGNSDATITGIPILWEDNTGANTLSVVNQDSPLPISIGDAVVVTGPSSIDNPGAEAELPLIIGGRASSALPNPVDTDNDFQVIWLTRSGAVKNDPVNYSSYQQSSLISGYVWYGFANPGSNPTTANFKIQRETLNTGEVLFANGAATFINVWSAASLASINYL